MRKYHLLFISLFVVVLFLAGCSDDDDDNPVDSTEQELVGLTSPFLICASRNPGGVGFDFGYNSKAGGANNMDSLSVDDFDYDILIKTVKAEKTDGSLGGMPYIALSGNALAVNYSGVDATCTGYSAYEALTLSALQSYTLKSDDDDFDLSDLTTGDTGKPLMAEVKAEYAKLVIGQKWKTSANNDVDGDELIWIIQTNEGDLVKLIITDFPADPAPTATGYIAVEWDFLD
ncbi:MAG: hypothetical protein PVH88_22475 [Ignavibacteria bacterium]|jgi:hypothetical protein